MRHRNGTRRKVRWKLLKREQTISRDVAERIRIEAEHDQDAVPVFVGEAILLELEIQAHDHICVVCGRRLLEEVICPDYGTVPEWVRQAKGATR